VWSEVLITLEAGNVGINWDSLHKGITQEEPAFTAAQVTFRFLPPSRSN
jgi:hypothetical protein